MSTSTSTLKAHQILIVAHGMPAPQGSKKVVRGILIDDNPAALRAWRQAVKAAAAEALKVTPGWFRDYPAIVGNFAFTLPRPAYHFKGAAPSLEREAGTELNPSAPHLHGVRPDLDKLLRSTWDALTTASVYPDDSRLAQVHAVKTYPTTDPTSEALRSPGVRIILAGVVRV